jgi:hypothetical protein
VKANPNRVVSVAERIEFTDSMEIQNIFKDFESSYLEKVPKHDILRYSINPAIGIAFKNTPFTQDFTIHNKTTKEAMFLFLQASPSKYFSVTPSFLIIQPLDHAKIHVHFTPQPFLLRHKLDVPGFLRVRTISGFPMER